MLIKEWGKQAKFQNIRSVKIDNPGSHGWNYEEDYIVHVGAVVPATTTLRVSY